MRKGNWMITYTGKRFYPLDPHLEDVCIEDIAHGLSNLCRYNGQCKFFFSVAQHSLNCCAYAKRMGLSKRLQLLCLLHDAAEAYVGDCIRPLKPHLPAFQVIENKVMHAIYLSFGIVPPEEHERDTIARIDTTMLVTEAQVLMPQVLKWCDWAEGIEPDPVAIINQGNIDIVKADFVSEINRYLKEDMHEQLPDAPTNARRHCRCADGQSAAEQALSELRELRDMGRCD